MRLGVLDVGSNTAHFLVVDAHQGGCPLPVFSHKAELFLGAHLAERGELSAACARQLRAFVAEALQLAEDKGVQGRPSRSPGGEFEYVQAARTVRRRGPLE